MTNVEKLSRKLGCMLPHALFLFGARHLLFGLSRECTAAGVVSIDAADRNLLWDREKKKW